MAGRLEKTKQPAEWPFQTASDLLASGPDLAGASRTVKRRPGSASLLLAACAAVGVAWQGESAPPRRESIELVDPAPRSIEATVLAEAVDGGLLLELGDDRYVLANPGTIVSRRPLPHSLATPTPRERGERIIAELPPGFELLITRHYIVCYDTTRDYAKWSAALFERLHEAFRNFWSQAGLEVTGPSQPLVVVIFSDKAAYEAHAADDLGAAAERVVGYYNLLSNHVTTFDLTETDGLARPGGPSTSTAARIMASPAAAGLVATLVHEATHQLAFNCGMHRRLAPVPLWVSEGIATYFETPDLASSGGWRGIGPPNRPRLDHFLAHHRSGDIAAIIASDERFRAADAPLDAYAAAWALTRYLMEAKKREFVQYLRLQASKQPLAEDTPAARFREFEQTFGAPAEAVEREAVKSAARLQSRLR